ncbi:hypothetical protein ACKS0A_02580 [Histoplasma ohiense]
MRFWIAWSISSSPRMYSTVPFTTPLISQVCAAQWTLTVPNTYSGLFTTAVPDSSILTTKVSSFLVVQWNSYQTCRLTTSSENIRHEKSP